MIENKLKKILKAGGTAVGTMVCDTRTPGIAQALAVAGFDFFILDTEHGSYSLETVSDMMVTARLAGITPIVRVPDHEYPFIARTMDAGALGIMAPRIKTQAQVEKIVRCVKYPPIGERGMNAARTNTDYRGVKLSEYAAKANAETMVIAQIETREAVEDIDNILSVPGVDAALMGPTDLSMSLGTQDLAHPKVAEYIQKTLDGAKRRGIPCGTHTADMENLKSWRDKGMKLLLYNYDFGFILSGGAAAVKELK
ncbi:MAG: aldolase [Planctomycetes bacterium]|nr:aldolase [Planctomycetota bacterium]